MPTLAEAREKVRDLSMKALAVVEDATMTASDQKIALDKIEPDLKQWMKEVSDLEFVADKRKQLLGANGKHDAVEAGEDHTDDGKAHTWGDQFVRSSGYKGLINRGLKGGTWSSGDIELKAVPAGTLVEGAGGGGAALIATPNVLPGYLPILFEELTVADLFPQIATDSPLIRYLVETVATNAAAETAEGELKPVSALGFDKVDETLHKIATFLPVSDEMLEDWSQIRGYIDSRLSLFVRQREQTQLLNGNGTGANLTGLLSRSGLATEVVNGTAPSVSGDNAMDVIFRQITAIRIASFMEPDAVVMEPGAWADVMLLKNEQGNYYASGPFVGTAPASLWGKRVVVTSDLPDGHSLVGAFRQGGAIFRKGGLTVEASNSHADFFQRNITAIRAEERLGLAVYRPQAFGLVQLAAGGGG